MANGAFTLPGEERTTLQKIGAGLSGFGAGVQGRGPEFLALGQQREQQLSLERQQAAAEDLRRAKLFMDQGDIAGIRDLAANRVEMIQQLGGNPSETRQLLGLAEGALQGDRVAFDRLGTEINAGLLSAADAGIIELQPPAKTRGAASPLGKIAQDVEDGVLTKEEGQRATEAFFATGADSPSALQEKIEFMVATGIPEDTAIKIATGVFEVSINPTTGQRVVISKATGRPVNEPPLPKTAVVPERPPGAPDISAATGGSGFFGNIINTLSDAVGAGLAFPRAKEAEAALDTINLQTISTLQVAVPGRPSQFLLEKIGDITVSPNSLLQGDAAAETRLKQTRDFMAAEIRRMDRDVLSQEAFFKPEVIQETKQNRSQLNALLGTYDAMIDSFGKKKDRPPIESFIRD